jgi:hypothetical protein
MKKLMITLILRTVFVLAVLPLTLPAQPVQGEWEMTLGGNGNSEKDLDNAALGLNFGVGYYCTPQLEVSIRQSFNHSGDTWNGATALGADWHFDLNKFRPFLGANLGWIYGKNMDESFALGPEAGLKYYVLDKTFIYGMVEYLFLANGTRDVQNNWNNGNLRYTLGIGFNF